MKYAALQNVLGEPLESVFEVAARLGFDGVELDWRHQNDRFDAPALKNAAQAAGVEISGLAAHFLNQGNIANLGKDAEAGIAIAEGIALCVELGTPVLLVPFFGAAEISDATEALLIENLQPLAQIAQASEVILALETARRGDAMKRVFEAVDSPNLGSYWDMANCLALGFDALEELEQLKNHLARVHAKEWSGPQISSAPGQYPGLNKVAFGAGDVDVAATLQKLRAIGYDDYLTLETGAFSDKHQSARAALETLKKFA